MAAYHNVIPAPSLAAITVKTTDTAKIEISPALTSTRAALASRSVAAETLDSAMAAAHHISVITGDVPLAQAALAFEATRLLPKLRVELARIVGEDAARLAGEIAKLGDLQLAADWAPTHGLGRTQAESLRQMFLSEAREPRVLLARLALQLERLRAARHSAPAVSGMLAMETRIVFGPLANRLGVWQLKWELEDWAFRYLQSEDYRRLAAALSERRADRERYIQDLCQSLDADLERAGVRGSVQGRPKHLFSIWRKMHSKQLPLEAVYDIRAARILCDSIPDCYAALGVVHSRFRNLPDEFDDYIATPKENSYRSIHTVVTGPDDKLVEVQIRTHEMHAQAELGVAAHWRYKEGGARNTEYERKIERVRELLQPQVLGASADYLENVRADLFSDRIYAMTPKGEVLDLPCGATSLDFAYHVHTDLGHRCRGSRVNGRIAPLTQALQSGDVVEIITGKHSAPSRDWLLADQGFLVSARSKAKVRAWFKSQAEAISNGAQRSGERNSGREVERGSSVPPVIARRKTPAANSARNPIDIEGVGDLPVALARCCAPHPPEPIAGYATVARGVTVHRTQCPGLLRMVRAKPERELTVSWRY